VVTPAAGDRTVRVGVALSATELCASDGRLRGDRIGAHGFRMPLDAMNGDTNGGVATWPSLTTALRELGAALGVAGGTLDVALSPPLAEVRVIELPPLGEAELQRLLARNAGRYFVAARGAQVVGTSVPARRKRGAPVPVVAAAAPLRLIVAIREAARDAGWTVEIVAPAETAWAGAATVIWPALARRDGHVLVTHDERTDLLQLENGRLAGVRRFRAGAADAAAVAEALIPPAGAAQPRSSVVAFGRTAPRDELARALSALGVAVTPPPAEWAERAASPERIAALHAGAEDGPVLRTVADQETRREHARRATMIVVATAAALFVLAAGIELWGVKRQLADVQAQRAALKPQLATTLVGRMSVDGAWSRLSELTAAERDAPRWSVVLARLSEHLVSDAYLTGFRGRGDSVVIDGLADRAALVFNAIERTPGLSGVRAAAPVRREAPADGGDPMERFTLAARVGDRRTPAADAPPRTSPAPLPPAPPRPVSP
jgi:hypothetical protein